MQNLKLLKNLSKFLKCSTFSTFHMLISQTGAGRVSSVTHLSQIHLTTWWQGVTVLLIRELILLMNYI